MARRNYDQMYKKNVNEEINELEKQIEEIKEEKKEEEKVIVHKKIEEEKKAPSNIGTIIGGHSLNVRKQPNGEIINLLKEGSQVRIVDDSNPEWYKIDSPEGYVMKKFVKIKED